jgi:FG-GAP-like repeat/FG-GAP repeat
MKAVCANARLQVISVILCCVGLQQIAQAQQFAPAVNYPTGTNPFRNPFSVAVGDFNQDGIPDLVVANAYQGGPAGTVGILLGNGDGTFRASREYGAGGAETSSVAVGDFNGDGKLDLVVANEGDQPLAPDNVGVLLGNGDGTFQPVVVYIAGSRPSFVAVGDFNGDGKLDFVATGDSRNIGVGDIGGVSVFLGKGDGTFAPAVNYPTGFSPISVAVADFNGDGRLDLAVANENSSSISVLLGTGDGTFQAAVNYPLGPFTQPTAIASGDFNGDGKLDLVVANRSGASVIVLIGNGDGTFQAPVSYPAGAGPWSVAVGDFNTDGKLDLIVSAPGEPPAGKTVNLLLGNGDGTFQAPAPYIVGVGPLSVAAADLNSDGLLDVAVANDSSGDVSVLLNVGAPPVSGRLAALLTEVTGVGPGKSLANKVALAQTYYAAKDVQATCAVLTGFVDEVKAQAGKKIAHALDAKLMVDANAIETAVDCN